MFHGGVQETAAFSKLHNLVELARDFEASHPQDCAVEKYILSACQFRMEPGTHFEQAADPASKLCLAFGWFGDPRQDFQQSRFARSISSDNAEHLASTQLQRQIPQRPKLALVDCW